MEQLRQLRSLLQAGRIEHEEYERARLEIVDYLTGTSYDANPYSSAALAARQQAMNPEDGSWAVKVTELQPAAVTGSRRMGWYLAADGQHKYHIPALADGTYFVDTSKGALRRSYLPTIDR